MLTILRSSGTNAVTRRGPKSPAARSRCCSLRRSAMCPSNSRCCSSIRADGPALQLTSRALRRPIRSIRHNRYSSRERRTDDSRIAESERDQKNTVRSHTGNDHECEKKLSFHNEPMCTDIWICSPVSDHGVHVGTELPWLHPLHSKRPKRKRNRRSQDHRQERGHWTAA